MIKRLTALLLFSSTLVINVNAQDRTSIKLATEEWAPFSFKDKNTNKISGLSTDIIYGTFSQMGVKISSNRVMPWARTQELGYEGKYDAVYTASMNDERKEYMYFPKEPVILSKWVLFATKKNRDKLSFNGFNSLKGKKFCLIAGYNYPKVFKDYITKNAKMTIVAKEDLNIAKLIHGRCDYMPAVLETTLDIAKNNPHLKRLGAYDKIFYFTKPLSISKFYLMFSKKTVSKQFVDKFSDELHKFKETKRYKQILKKYL